MDNETIRKFKGKKVRVSYLEWAELREAEGFIVKINKCSIKLADDPKSKQGILIKTRSIDIKELE